MTAAQATLNIELSHDELAWLLYTLRVPPLLGMGASLYPAGTPEAIANARLQAGGLALQARGLAAPVGDCVEIESALVGMVGAFAMAERAVLLKVAGREDSAASARAYYLSPDLTVAHELVAPRIHRLTGIGDRDAFLDHLLDGLDAAGCASEDFRPRTIPTPAFEAARDAVREGDVGAARDTLRQAGWDPHSGERLVHMLETWTWSASITVFAPTGADDAPGLSAQGSITLLGNDDRVVGLATEAAARPMVTVGAFSGQYLRAYIARLVGLAT